MKIFVWLYKCNVLCYWVFVVRIWYFWRIYSIPRVGNYSISEIVSGSHIFSLTRTSTSATCRGGNYIKKSGYKLCKCQIVHCQDLKKMTIFRCSPQCHIKKLLDRLSDVSCTLIHSSVKRFAMGKTKCSQTKNEQKNMC